MFQPGGGVLEGCDRLSQEVDAIGASLEQPERSQGDSKGSWLAEGARQRYLFGCELGCVLVLVAEREGGVGAPRDEGWVLGAPGLEPLAAGEQLFGALSCSTSCDL